MTDCSPIVYRLNTDNKKALNGAANVDKTDVDFFENFSQ